MTERAVESREPLEWVPRKDKRSPAIWKSGLRWAIVPTNSGKFWLQLHGSFIATVGSPDEAKDLAQRLQDVLDGVPDQARAEGPNIGIEEMKVRLSAEWQVLLQTTKTQADIIRRLNTEIEALGILRAAPDQARAEQPSDDVLKVFGGTTTTLISDIIDALGDWHDEGYCDGPQDLIDEIKAVVAKANTARADIRAEALAEVVAAVDIALLGSLKTTRDRVLAAVRALGEKP